MSHPPTQVAAGAVGAAGAAGAGALDAVLAAGTEVTRGYCSLTQGADRTGPDWAGSDRTRPDRADRAEEADLDQDLDQDLGQQPLNELRVSLGGRCAHGATGGMKNSWIVLSSGYPFCYPDICTICCLANAIFNHFMSKYTC